MFGAVPVLVSVQVVPDSEPLYVTVPPGSVTVVEGTDDVEYGSDAFESVENA